MSLLSLCALLFLQSHLFPICVALTYNDSRKDLHRLCQIPRNCQCKWLLVPCRLQELLQAPFGFLRSFCFARIRLDPLGGQVLHHDCMSKIVSRFTTSLRTLWSAVIKSPKFSALGTTLPARPLQEALVILFSSRYRNLGPSGSACRHYAYPNSVPLFARDSTGNSWEELEVSWLPCFGFPSGSKDYVHRPNSLWNPVASPASHAMDLFVLLRVPHFYFIFSVSVGLCCRFPRLSSLVLALLSGTEFSVYLLTLNTESCDEDVEEVGVGVVEEELVDKPGTTNGTLFDILQSILLPFLVRCGFWPLVQWCVYPWSSQSFPRARTAGVSSRNITVTNKSNSLMPLLLLSFAPRRWPSSPSSDSSMASWSPTQQSSGLSCWPPAYSLQNPPQTLFPPALLLTQPGVPILPRASGM